MAADLPQRTESSLIGSTWTRKSDGAGFVVINASGEIGRCAGPATRVILSSLADSRQRSIGYPGLLRRYRDDAEDFEAELIEIATGGPMGQG